MHADVPDNVAARLVQTVGDLDAGFDAAPHTLELDLQIERSCSMPLEGKAVHARWDADDRSLRVYSSTQASTSVRAAIAAKLGLPLGKVEVIAPDVGGGFGAKIVHPWPEEITVPFAADPAGPPGQVDRGPSRTLRLAPPTSVVSSTTSESDSTTPEGFSALDVQFWHDNGAYTPYGIICPIVTSTQLLGPYKPGAYRVEFVSVYTNTVIVTPVPRRRPAAGRVRDGTDDGPRSPPASGSTAPRCGRPTSSSPTSSPTTRG